MLSSLLKIEQYLKCEICLSTLRQTRLVAECGHRFCLDCIKEKLAISEACPTCGLPAHEAELLKDPMHDNLVSYVSKLKSALLSHALTPLEDSLLNKRELSSTQDSEDQEEEYRDLPATKKFKPSESFIDERPMRKKPQPIYFDDMSDDDMPDANFSMVGAPYVPEEPIEVPPEPIRAPEEPIEEFPEPIREPEEPQETKTTGETWQCTECEFKNETFVQSCGVCKNSKNRNIGVVKRRKSRASEVQTMSTLADQSLDNATLPSIRSSRNPKKDVHIIFTSVSEKEMLVIDEHMERVAESKLQIHIGTELKDMEKTTHVIASVNKNNQCYRTLKYLDGVLTGKWIVTPNWLLDSMKAKRWLPETNYQVQGDSKSGTTHAPEKGRKQQTGLFQGMNFYFAGEFSEVHNKKDLTLLIRDGGGNVESRKPALDADQLTTIVYNKQTTKRKLHWLEGYEVRDTSWIIDSISRLELLK